MFAGIAASCGIVKLPDAMINDHGCPAIGCPPPPGPLSCYLPAGTCEDGACSYAFNDGAACDDGDDCTVGDTCARGACSGRPRLCDDPGPPVCIDGSTLRVHGMGSCSSGGCTYLPVADEACPHGCAGGQCNAVKPAISAGFGHTCVLSSTGRVRCWGYNDRGQLGYGHTQSIGDDESPVGSGDVDVGGVVTQISAGDHHTCALLHTGTVRCWGEQNGDGRLGYGNSEDIGDDETPKSAGDVNVGGPVKQIAAGGRHTCALLESGKVRCWGRGDLGALGYGNKETIGDDEPPESAGDVDVGGAVVELSTGWTHTCALLQSGSVRCWGNGTSGQLGKSDNLHIGDNESPGSVGVVQVGEDVMSVQCGAGYTCIQRTTGSARCFGDNREGQLGAGHTNNIYDAAKAVDVTMW